MTRHFSHRVRRLWRGKSGTNLIESAIVVPLLLLLTFSVIDFSTIFYSYLACENGVAQATRYGVTGNQMDDPSNPGTKLSRADSMVLAMRQATPTLTLPSSAFSFYSMAPGGSTWVSGVGGPNDIVKMNVTYTWSLLTPVLRPFFTSGQFSFTVSSAMKNEGRFN